MRLAPDTTAAIEIARKEMLDIWTDMSNGNWFDERNALTQSGPNTNDPNTR